MANNDQQYFCETVEFILTLITFITSNIYIKSQIIILAHVKSDIFEEMKSQFSTGTAVMLFIVAVLTRDSLSESD